MLKSAYSQHVDVYKQLKGDELVQALKDSFRPNSTLGYSSARDTLFFKILAQNSAIKCLYTDYQIILTPGLDPSEEAFSKGINTEHIVPQSKGAENEPLKSDMFNLYPSREEVNSDRGNNLFGEIPDSETKWWYYLDKKQTQKPLNNIESYSEGTSSQFEPSENKKGDIARSVFYFFTVYHDEMIQADPVFFEAMTSDLCKWHFDDPVDLPEWNKNAYISIYQENKANPFILDCTLPQRTYCNNGMECIPIIENNRISNLNNLTITPNFGNANTLFTIQNNQHLKSIKILDIKGNHIQIIPLSNAEIIKSLSFPNLPNGKYFLIGYDKYGYVRQIGKINILY